MNKNTATLKKYLLDFLSTHSFVKCKALKNRKVFLAKQPEAIIKRKDLKNRLQAFFAGIDVLKKSDCILKRKRDGKKEYEIIGLSAEGKKIFVHVREEFMKKDKKLFLISTYYKS